MSASLKRDMTASLYVPKTGYRSNAENISEILSPNNWNTMKIKAKGKHYKVWLNNKLVLDTHSDISVKQGPIGLQLKDNSDMAIDFKDIKVAEI